MEDNVSLVSGKQRWLANIDK